MGEAKRRSTEIVKLKSEQSTPGGATAVEGLRKKHDLPDDAIFDGFVVWLKERDEFLVRLTESSGATTRAYGSNVDSAVRFGTFHEAEPHAKASKHQAIVAAAFDIGNQIAIVG